MKKIFFLIAAMTLVLSASGCAASADIRADDSADGFVGEEYNRNDTNDMWDNRDYTTDNDGANGDDYATDGNHQANAGNNTGNSAARQRRANKDTAGTDGITQGAKAHKRSIESVQKTIAQSYAKHGVH